MPHRSRPSRLFARFAALSYAGIALTVLSTCSVKTSVLGRVIASETLRVATVYGRTTCYAGPEGVQGYECDLVSGLARSLNVNVEVTFTNSPEAAINAVLEGRADIAAAGISSGMVAGKPLRFTHSVDLTVPRLVYRLNTAKPESFDDVTGLVKVAASSGYGSLLAQHAKATPRLRWTATDAADSEDLLIQVAKGELDHTIASSALIAIEQRYYPQLAVAFDVGPPSDVGFALASGMDPSLYIATQNYLTSISGKYLQRLHDRYYGHVNEVDYFDSVAIAARMRDRLPRYLSTFKSVANKYNLDWRLLAAIGYQESQWQADAISFTGVRGLMQLTGATAQRYNVNNREDPVQSIHGGARALLDIIKALPPEIAEPDRTWLALAGYNQGLGHLLDAMQLTAKRGGDPHHWLDVRDTFPLLSRPRWHSQTKYGYSRGNEAVDYVGNVRAYFDIITWLTSGHYVAPSMPLKLDQTLTLSTRPAASSAAPTQLAPDKPANLQVDEHLSLPETAPSPASAPADEGVAEAQSTEPPAISP